jgi:spermidine synthase
LASLNFLPRRDTLRQRCSEDFLGEDRRQPEDWIRETHDGGYEIGFRVEKVLFSQRSRFQQVQVVQTATHGRMLLIDGVVMLSERDEYIYHEMIAHVPLFVHPRPRSVLIIGGGDGGTAREVLRHACVERAVMVEIDEVVIRACRRHLPSVSGALSDSRLELVVGDGIRYTAETEEHFDVVIVDSADPIGPGMGLFGRSFYEQIARILEPGGIMITQAESPFYDPSIQRAMFSGQRSLFQRLHLYLYTTLSYAGGLYGFGFASRGRCPVRDLQPNRIEAAGIAFRYYSYGVHQAAFALPAFVRDNLSGLLDPLPMLQPTASDRTG